MYNQTEMDTRFPARHVISIQKMNVDECNGKNISTRSKNHSPSKNIFSIARTKTSLFV